MSDDAELARLRTAVRDLREIIAARDRALEAEQRARAIAQADSMVLREALVIAVENIGTDMHYVSYREEQKMRAALAADHPGAALLTELDAARTVISMVRWAVENHYAPPPMHDALVAYDAIMKERQP